MFIFWYLRSALHISLCLCSFNLKMVQINTEKHEMNTVIWINLYGKCLVTKHHQTLFGDQTFYCLATLFGTA